MEAVHERAMVEVVVPVTERFVGTVGGVVSGDCSVLPEVEDDCPETLPALSNAVRSYVYVLLGVRPESVKVTPLGVAI